MGRPHKGPRRPIRTFALISALGTGVVAWGLYAYTALPPLLIYLLAVSVCAFLLCAYDKRIAGGEHTRVPERVLFATALVGGTPGLLAGMNIFRHKTKKRSFQLKFAAIFVVQVAVVAWWLLR
ncbi:MAG: DUF1294 domain-containing protein [Myxococcota bacterium]